MNKDFGRGFDIKSWSNTYDYSFNDFYLPLCIGIIGFIIFVILAFVFIKKNGMFLSCIIIATCFIMSGITVSYYNSERNGELISTTYVIRVTSRYADRKKFEKTYKIIHYDETNDEYTVKVFQKK